MTSVKCEGQGRCLWTFTRSDICPGCEGMFTWTNSSMNSKVVILMINVEIEGQISGGYSSMALRYFVVPFSGFTQICQNGEKL